MKKLILAGVAAATLATGGVGLSQPAHAAGRCWWTGPVRHCRWVRPAWRYGYYHHPWGWYR
jgi:hypothetical protein